MRAFIIDAVLQTAMFAALAGVFLGALNDHAATVMWAAFATLVTALLVIRRSARRAL
jgi:hypothetical protein